MELGLNNHILAKRKADKNKKESTQSRAKDSRGFGVSHSVKIHPDYLDRFKQIEANLKGQDSLNIELSVGSSNFGNYELWATKIEKVSAPAK